MNATKKKNEMKKDENEISTDQPWKQLPPWSGLELSDELTSLPRGNLRRHIGLALHLEAQRPPVLTEREAQMLGRMVQGRVIAHATQQHYGRTAKVDIKSLWSRVVSRMASVRTPVVTQAKAGIDGVTAVAQEVIEGLLPHAHLSMLTPQEGWLEVDELRKKYDGDPVLAGKLIRFMPPEVPRALFEVNDHLGKALGLTERAAATRVIMLTSVHAHLSRQITAYVRCIAASADDTDVDSVERAASALQPIAEFREANARKVARTKTAESAVVEEDEEDTTPVDTTAPPDAVEEDTEE